jgi:hypothetical protein
MKRYSNADITKSARSTSQQLVYAPIMQQSPPPHEYGVDYNQRNKFIRLPGQTSQLNMNKAENLIFSKASLPYTERS